MTDLEVILATGETFQVPSTHPVCDTCITLQLAVAEGSTQVRLPKPCMVTARQFKEYLLLESIFRIFSPDFDDNDPQQIYDPRVDHDYTEDEEEKFYESLYQQIKRRTTTAIVAMKTAMLMSDDPTVEKCLDLLYYITELYFGDNGDLGHTDHPNKYSYFLVGVIMREFENYEPIVKSVLPRLYPEYVAIITKSNGYDSAAEVGLIYNAAAFELMEDPPKFTSGTFLDIVPEHLIVESIENAARTGKLSDLENLYVSIMKSDENMTVDQMCTLLELESTQTQKPKLWYMIKDVGCDQRSMLVDFARMIYAATSGSSDFNNWGLRYPRVGQMRFTSKAAQADYFKQDDLVRLQRMFPHIMTSLRYGQYLRGEWKNQLLKENYDFFVREGRPEIAKKFYSPIILPPPPAVVLPNSPIL